MSELFGGQDERSFIERIRLRQRERNGSTPPEAYPFSKSAGDDELGESSGYEERVRLFTEALEGVGGHVRRAATVTEAYEVVVRELQRRGLRHVLLGNTGKDMPTLEEVLKEAGIQSDRWDELAFEFGSGERSVEIVDRWEAGIDRADFGVAELGSVAVVASESQSRTVSLLPLLHIALLPGERLVTHRRTVLAQVAKEHKATGRPFSLTFTTGPSRSADIEMDLSIGVHGPGEIIVIVIDPALM